MRSSPDIDTQRFPGKRSLENPLPQIACEKEAVRPLASQRNKETQLGNTDILRLIHDCKVKWRISTILELVGQ